MIDILKKYVDTGILLPEYQFNKLLNNRSLLTTYLRKRAIAVKQMEGDLKYYELNMIGVGIKNNIFKPEMLKLFVEVDKNIELFINPPSEQEQLDLVKQDSYAIRYIIDPSEDVQLAAVVDNIYAIRYIIDPSERVQLAAVEQDYDMIEYIKNPSENTQLYVVIRDFRKIKYIKNPSEKVQLAAVKQDGNLIKYIIENGIEPSEDVQLAAVEEDTSVFIHIKNPYPSVIEYLKSLKK